MNSDIAQCRLINQNLISTSFKNAVEVVHWFGAMQSQDFAAAKWAVALRTKDQTDADIERDFNEGKILRTHIMRPTWHFVTPADIRWILALTSPRVQAFNGYYYRKSGFDKNVFKKSNEIIQKALQGGKQLNRNEINTLLQEAKIPTKDVGLSFAMMQAELEGIICSGPRVGKQFTYMLLDERVPKVKAMERDEALSELTKRYFQSHGPAQIQDFVWWSGLTKTDAIRGVEMLGSLINKEEIEGNIYWYINQSDIENVSFDGVLLPGFDEYFIAYKDRHDILEKKYSKHLNLGGGMINGALVVEGKMIGKWKRSFGHKSVVIEMQVFEKITSTQHYSLEKQAQRYSTFIGLPLVLNLNK